MKKIFNLVLFSFAISFFYSCSNEDKVTDQVFAGIKSGVTLKTIKVDSPTFNFLDTSSKWEATLEMRGTNNDNRAKEVKVYVKHTTAGVTSAEKLLKTFPASVFVNAAPYDLPNAKLSATFAETLAALSLVPGKYTAADKFTMRLEVVLEDGRTYTDANASGTITGGSFFSSSFAYTVQFACPLTDASLFNGNYKVTVDAWQDYAIGDIVPVVYNAANGSLKFRILNTNNPYLVNKANTYYEVTVNPTDGSCTVISNETLNYGGGFLTNVTGKGSVGTCTGDINLTLNFSGSSQNQNFSLVKS
jgi:hypothetical protein